ncbi:MAG: hypothetical protein ABFR95_08155 [Actinomycetota bacterium]
MVATLQYPVDTSTEQTADSDVLWLAPGQIAGLTGLPGSGLTRIGMSLIAPYAAHGPLVYLDVRGWASPKAAWEMGIEPERLVVVRSKDHVSWGRIVATLLDGVRGVYAEVPVGLRDQSLYKLAAKARSRQTPLVLRSVSGRLPAGVAHLSLEAREVLWEGTRTGHGNLKNRRTLLEASGKATRGMAHTIEVEDDGTNDLRVVSRLGAQVPGRLTG